ncbi:hypothetical protein DFH08DRAFT_825529 [Mycena albidolilacea]|uniref:Uncharacterized protein n=1 Tax=Mycena albidolilacea TaxID=1033008 RepID=A0AAD7EA62_9AGAR|nr:hypothetical protein DFH08DRAFT_825529 [Mycena albidolilacea]
MAPVCGLLCPLTLFPVGPHAPLILRNDAFTNESAMEQDIGKISGLAQTLQSSLDPVPIRCTVPRTSTLSTATALPKCGGQGRLDVLASTLCSPRGPLTDAPL